MKPLWRCEVSPGHYVKGILWEEWYEIKKTPKGRWIVPEWVWYAPESPRGGLVQAYVNDTKKWVSDNTRFVSETKEGAAANLLYRKRANVRHCTRRLEEARRQYSVICEELGIENEIPKEVFKGIFVGERREDG